MKKLVFMLLCVSTISVTADQISLFDWGININGNISKDVSNLPTNVTSSDNFFSTGLGKVTILFKSAIQTVYNVGIFLDYEIDEFTNTFFNEYGSVEGFSNDPRLSYEIDEPGFGTDDPYRSDPDAYTYIGDIYNNFTDFTISGFDNMVYYDGYTGTNLLHFEDPLNDDVSMAMGWKFSLEEDETATLEYEVSTAAPASGLYLAQKDRNSTETAIYLQSSLHIEPVPPTQVPEPGVVSLLCIGFLSLWFIRKRSKC